MHVKTGDMVVVISGKERGLKGRILRVLPEKNRVVVEGRNLVKKHRKPNPLIGRDGGIVEQEAAIHVSNVLLYSEKEDGPVRTQSRYVGGDGNLFDNAKDALASFDAKPERLKKVRFAPKTGERFE